MPDLRQGQRHVQEGAGTGSPPGRGRPRGGSVDPVEGGEERQDHVGDIAVDEREDDGRRLASEPFAWLAEDVREDEEPVHVAVRGEQVHPREHPHQVADPEGKD